MLAAFRRLPRERDVFDSLKIEFWAYRQETMTDSRTSRVEFRRAALVRTLI